MIDRRAYLSSFIQLSCHLLLVIALSVTLGVLEQIVKLTSLRGYVGWVSALHIVRHRLLVVLAVEFGVSWVHHHQCHSSSSTAVD